MSTIPNCSLEARTLFFRYRFFFFGFFAALGIQLLRIWSLGGGLDTLLYIEAGPFLPFFQRELGDVTSFPSGHDGFWSYVIARFPFSPDGTFGDLETVSYRYRRILYPLLAGGFGFFPPKIILAGLALLACAGVGLSTHVLSKLFAGGRRELLALSSVLLNPGIVFALSFLTSDSLAFGLALLGLHAQLNNRTLWAAFYYSLSILCKEMYLLFPLCFIVTQLLENHCKLSSRAVIQSFLTMVLAIIPYSLWLCWLSYTLSSDFSTYGQIGLPLVGLITVWNNPDLITPSEKVLVITSVAAMLVSAASLFRASSVLIRILIATHLLLLVSLSSEMWEWGNNIIRSMLPLWTLSILALSGARVSTGEEPLKYS